MSGGIQLNSAGQWPSRSTIGHFWSKSIFELCPHLTHLSGPHPFQTALCNVTLPFTHAQQEPLIQRKLQHRVLRAGVWGSLLARINAGWWFLLFRSSMWCVSLYNSTSLHLHLTQWAHHRRDVPSFSFSKPPSVYLPQTTGRRGDPRRLTWNGSRHLDCCHYDGF